MTETEEPVLGFADLTPELQKLAVVMTRLNMVELAKNPPLLSGWLTLDEEARYRKMKRRAVETEIRLGTGPERSKPHENGKGQRVHVDSIDRYYREHMVGGSGE